MKKKYVERDIIGRKLFRILNDYHTARIIRKDDDFCASHHDIQERAERKIRSAISNAVKAFYKKHWGITALDIADFISGKLKG